ncbi:MAG: site-specific integrase [Gammaproteobacteria bacterium]|nr:site-specific integrase [Gammaproteobacteria bacterium]
MATIVKQPSGKWKSVIRLKGWPTTSKTFRTKRDAEDWSRTTEDEMIRGVFIKRSGSERTTLTNAISRYLKEVTITKKQSTQRRDHSSAKILIKHLGKYSLSSLTPDRIAQHRDERLADGLSNNTVRLELALLGHLYTVAIQEWGMGLMFNPVSNVRKPSPGQGRNRRLSLDEEIRMFEVLDSYSNPMLAWLARIALYTAMRQGEILNLTRNQVDLTRGIVRLTETKNGSSRTVPLSDKAKQVFAEALSNPVRPIDTNLIFFGEPGRNGKRKPYTIGKIWLALVRDKAGIEDLKFHDLRHEATSRFVEAGLSDQEVSSITGHKSMQMLKRYTHLRTEDLSSKIKNL